MFDRNWNSWVWRCLENETLTVIDVDLTNITGDFVSLSLEYFADTFFEIDSDGNIEPSDFMSLDTDYEKNSTEFSGNIYGQWNDYNEDGTCQIDEDGNGIVNETNPIDFEEINTLATPETQTELDNRGMCSSIQMVWLKLQASI